MLKNWCVWTVVLEKTLESPLDCKEIQPIHPKRNQSWMFTGRIDAKAETLTILATRCKELTHWKRPWWWERLRVGGERDDRGWDGWMASPTQWTWVWVDFGSWWWTGRPGMLWFMVLQRVGHDWVTEPNWKANSLQTATESTFRPVDALPSSGSPWFCSGSKKFLQEFTRFYFDPDLPFLIYPL